ncbi:MAG: methyltransferase domain-containing protein [Bacteroidetes bacterium]|nr:methyltransferase domain-containing protein [Bacteroidota bacterium]
MLRWLLLPAKYRHIEKYIGDRPFALLDIGAGNHSASKTKKWFPNCEYHGVDLDKTYNNDENDLRLMHAFYEMNLEDLQFDIIPDNYFDFIMCAHVIEHLKNGDLVLEKLLSKIKVGGYLYVEYPGYHSTQLPSMYGTLNFFDDHTHVRIYSVSELMNLFMRKGMKIISGGTRRHLPTMLLMPLKIFHNFFVYKKVLASIFWDYFGFAEFVLIQKPVEAKTNTERQTIKY